MSAELETHLQALNTTDNFKALFRQHGIHYAWFAIGTVMIAMLATLLSGTIVNVAIPQIMGSFGIGQDVAQWLSTGNLAAAAIGMIVQAWLAQTLGLRNMMLIVMLLFMAGSLIGGISNDISLLIFSRLLQGFASGVIAPLSMSIIFQLFPSGRQGMAMGISSIGALLAPALGPTIGGLLIDTFNWRYVFFLAVPFSLICLPLTMLFLPERDGPRPHLPFDWTGLCLMTAAITSLLYGLSNGEKEGWSSEVIVLCLLLSITCAYLFVHWQSKAPYPLINLQLFNHRRYVIMVIISFIFGAGLYGSSYLLPLFLQIVQEMSPTNAGIAMMPSGFILALVFPLAGRLADRSDPRMLITAGIFFFACSCFLMVQADPNTGFWTLAWWMVLGRVGIGLVMPPVSLGALKNLPLELLQQGSGTMTFIRQLGGAFGVNFMSVMLTRRTQFHLDTVTNTQAFDNSETFEMTSQLSEHILGYGLTFWDQYYISIQILAKLLYSQAVMLGFRDAFLIGAIVFLLTLIPTWILRKPANQ